MTFLARALNAYSHAERRKALIAREHRHARARHDRIHILTSEILAIVKIARVGRRLEFAFGADAVAVAKIGERRRLDEHESFHRSRRLIGDDELVRLDAQVGVRVAHVRLADDDAFDDHRFLLIVVRGKRGLIKVRLREVVAERAQNRGECEDENPARLGRAPGQG